jgi:hypothetical protein
LCFVLWREWQVWGVVSSWVVISNGKWEIIAMGNHCIVLDGKETIWFILWKYLLGCYVAIRSLWCKRRSRVTSYKVIVATHGAMVAPWSTGWFGKKITEMDLDLYFGDRIHKTCQWILCVEEVRSKEKSVPFLNLLSWYRGKSQVLSWPLY